MEPADAAVAAKRAPREERKDWAGLDWVDARRAYEGNMSVSTRRNGSTQAVEECSKQDSVEATDLAQRGGSRRDPGGKAGEGLREHRVRRREYEEGEKEGQELSIRLDRCLLSFVGQSTS
jgi:hypothetical protein